MAFVLSPNPPQNGRLETVTVTVTAAAPASGTPIGKVTLVFAYSTHSPFTFPPIAPKNGSGATRYVVTLGGLQTVTANHGGDPSFQPATVSVAG